MPNPNPLPSQASEEARRMNRESPLPKYVPDFSKVYADPNQEKQGHRPLVYNWEGIADELEKYTALTRVPILKDFTTIINILYESMNEASFRFPRLSDSIKKAIAKKEANLEKGMLTNNLNATAAIFSLKQLGWADKVEQKFSVDVTPEQKKIIDETFSKLQSRLSTDQPCLPAPIVGGEAQIPPEASA